MPRGLKVPVPLRKRKAMQPGAQKPRSGGASKELRERRAGVIKSAKDETKRRRLGIHGKKNRGEGRAGPAAVTKAKGGEDWWAILYRRQFGVDQKWTIVSLTADELKYTNPAHVIGGKIDVAFKRATVATN